ncbi:TIGR04255 family protein [Amycolatopsis sp. NPDC003861]
MSDPREDRGAIEFERPPVQQVTLSLFFEPRFDLLTSDIFSARQRWVDRYPKLDEFPTTSAWRNFGEDGYVVAVGAAHVILPSYVMSSVNGDRAIRVQQDRFELVWRFADPDVGSRYVGYESLKQELLDRFDEFCQEVAVAADNPIEVLRMDATYENLVDINVRDFCVGMLTGWKVASPVDLPASKYSGMRFSDVEDAGDEQSHNFVAVDPGPDGIGTNFIVDVQCDRVEGSSLGDRLDVAHTAALELFFRLTSDSMRAEWGQR